jgi:hypothetical protein
MATPSDRTRRRQAPTQQATPIVGPRPQGRPSPYSPAVRAAIAGRAGMHPGLRRQQSPQQATPIVGHGKFRGYDPTVWSPLAGFRDQPLPQQATGGRFGSIDETMPQPSPRFRPYKVARPQYGTEDTSFYMPEYRVDPRFDPYPVFSSPFEYSEYQDDFLPQTRVRTPAPPVARDNQRNRFGAPAEDPGLYNLYQMMMGRRRNRDMYPRPRGFRDQPLPPYEFSPSPEIALSMPDIASQAIPSKFRYLPFRP